MKAIIPLIGLASLALASDGFAAEPEKAANPQVDIAGGAEAQADDPLNKVVCRRVKATGSRLGSARVCKTRGEWAAEQQQNRRDIDNVQSRNWKNNGG